MSNLTIIIRRDKQTNQVSIDVLKKGYNIIERTLDYKPELVKSLVEEFGFYEWLCSDCMIEVNDVEPSMDWPDFKPGTCDRCGSDKCIVFINE